jgi:hypothetical protein
MNIQMFIDDFTRNVKTYNVSFNQLYATESLKNDNHSGDLEIPHLSWNPMFITMFIKNTTGLCTEADGSSNLI